MTESSPLLVTFIIPSIGRPTLSDTLASLARQTRAGLWRALVILDGVDDAVASELEAGVASLASSARESIRFLRLPKRVGIKNHAGDVRNYGMAYVKTPWIAFVDDDDTVTADYVEKLETEISACPTLEVVIFRMVRYSDDGKALWLLPEPHTRGLLRGHVGISFALRTSVVHGSGSLKFEPGSFEDYELLVRLGTAGKSMVLSPYVTYHVRDVSKLGLPASHLGEEHRRYNFEG